MNQNYLIEGGSSLIKVYGEYAPFKRVNTLDDLIKSVEV
jgi:hypothetical protein